MGVAAFLCGLFYGGLALSAYRKAQARHYLNQFLDKGMERLLADMRGLDWELETEESKVHAERLSQVLRKADQGCAPHSCACSTDSAQCACGSTTGTD